VVKETKESYLDRLFIAAPCSVSWNSMKGNDQVRDCSMCSRRVYNLSAMTKRQAEDFLKENGASQCMRFYRRTDGTIMTDNCPVALRALRNSFRRTVGFLSSILAVMLSLPGALAQNNFRDAFKPPQAPPGMEYYPNPAGGGFVLRPASHDEPIRPDRPSMVITNYKNGQPVPIEIGQVAGHADTRALKLYMKGKELERSGNSLAAALYYRDALKVMSHQQSFDPSFKRLVEKDLEELKRGTQSHL
jgi:hypothetical protein